jgi:uncharacterized membrane protein YedE/YeeE
MRKLLTVSLAALAICFLTAPLLAAPGGDTQQNATPLTQLVQDNYYGNYGYGFGWGTGYNYIPACPTNYHYTCWYDPYGYRHCGCVLNRW